MTGICLSWVHAYKRVNVQTLTSRIAEQRSYFGICLDVFNRVMTWVINNKSLARIPGAVKLARP